MTWKSLSSFAVIGVVASLPLFAALPAAAQSACPSGYRFRPTEGDCLSVRAPSCPSGYRISADRAQCHGGGSGGQAGISSCPAGYEFHRLSRTSGECRSERPASCPTGTRLDSRIGRCVRGAIPQ